MQRLLGEDEEMAELWFLLALAYKLQGSAEDTHNCLRECCDLMVSHPEDADAELVGRVQQLCLEAGYVHEQGGDDDGDDDDDDDDGCAMGGGSA
jgi:hypothetical protein